MTRVRDVSSAIGRNCVFSMHLDSLFLDGEINLFIDHDTPLRESMPNTYLAFQNAFLDLMVWNGIRPPEVCQIVDIFHLWSCRAGFMASNDAFARYQLERDFLDLSSFIRHKTLFPDSIMSSRKALDEWIAHRGWNGLPANEQTFKYLSDEDMKIVVDTSKHKDQDPYWIHLF